MEHKRTTPTEEPIDIYKHAQNLERELARLDQDERINPKNCETIRRFIRDARIGRTVQHGARRKLSLGRCRKLLSMLRMYSRLIKVPFEEVTVDQMETLILDLEEGRIMKIQPYHTDQPYSHSFVLDLKKDLRKFYAWLMPDKPDRVKELTGWFDTRSMPPPLKVFTLQDVEEMLRVARSQQMRTVMIALFDGGFRIGELMNVRLQDVRFKDFGGPNEVCMVRINVSKTKPRTISLPLAGRELKSWIRSHPDARGVAGDGQVESSNPLATLITYRYDYIRKMLRKIGRQVLGERLYPHRFRHSSATYYARRLNPYQLTARYGWTMGSKAIARYLDQAGILADEVADIMRGEARLRGSRQETVEDRSVSQLVRMIQNDPALASRLIQALAQRN